MADSSKPDCCSTSATGRRSFLQGAGAILGAAAAVPLPASAAARSLLGLPRMAGSLATDSQALPQNGSQIPVDKQLDPAWLQSLTARGEPEICRGEELRYIGMPIGGIGAGMVYLGGDGRLWLWDIFNRPHEGTVAKTVQFEGRSVPPRNGANYVEPNEQVQPFEQGFALRIEQEDGTPGTSWPLDRRGFRKIEFQGEYPLAQVRYRDASCAVDVDLQAFPLFEPLQTDLSSQPCILLEYTLHNSSADTVLGSIEGWMENPVLLHNRDKRSHRSRIDVRRHDLNDLLTVQCTAVRKEADHSGIVREDVLFADFEGGDYQNWESSGTAFGDGPRQVDELANYQGDVAAHGQGLVNSHQTRGGENVTAGDAHQGTLTSENFVVTRHWINFRIGGGKHTGQTCLELLMDGKVVRSATGHDHNRMRPERFDVREFEGQQAQLRIADRVSGPWGNIGIDHIVFSDVATEPMPMEQMPDFGSISMAVHPVASQGFVRPGRMAPELGRRQSQSHEVRDFDEDATAFLGRRFRLKAGEKMVVTFAIGWSFPSLSLPGMGAVQRWQRNDAGDSEAELVRNVMAHRKGAADTRLWHQTWNDSTLPHWLLNRTFLNTSTLATNTCYWIATDEAPGRKFWAWEGIGCCAGTCTHVWHYAQAPARLFPDIERNLREVTDFGPQAFDAKSGRIDFRGGLAGRWAADGQAALILRCMREHQMSADPSFLRKNWSNIRQALQFLIDQDRADGTADGMLAGEQHNTLDAEWFGRIPAIASLYLAALSAGVKMSLEMEDAPFSEVCLKLWHAGRVEMQKLFDEEFFIQQEDPQHLDAIGVGKGCYIDQVIGQGWAWQLGLPPSVDAEQARSALQALWKYNFAPDMGPVRESLPPGVRGRPYAIAGDAGLVMCTWPKGGRNPDWQKHWQYMYFNECMSGFEYQAAAHMIREGLVTEGLAVTRAIHDRYHPRLRNPYNEIECSDHYARAMASYGVYLAVCGFEYHGPQGRLGFAPKIRPLDFRCAFVAAQGWGSFSQKVDLDVMRVRITIVRGKLSLNQLTLEAPADRSFGKILNASHGVEIPQIAQDSTSRSYQLTWSKTLLLQENETLEITLKLARSS